MSLLSPMRRLLVPRPAIQAWRNARYYATETTETTISQPPPMPLDQSSPAMTESTITPPVPSSGSGTGTGIIPIDQDQSSLAITAEGSALAPVSLGSKPQKGRKIVGIVVDAGKMDKTVKVRIPGQTWNNYLRKVNDNTLLYSRKPANIYLALQLQHKQTSPRPSKLAAQRRRHLSARSSRLQTRPPHRARDHLTVRSADLRPPRSTNRRRHAVTDRCKALR